jgi:hypothetical protein
MIFNTLFLFGNTVFAAPEINNIKHKIVCDPNGTQNQVVEVDKSKLKDGVAFVFDKKTFANKDVVLFNVGCDGASISNGGTFNIYKSERISGDINKTCGHFAEYSNFDGYYDGHPLSLFFIQPPKSVKNKFTVAVRYQYDEFEPATKIAQCTMKFVDSPSVQNKSKKPSSPPNKKPTKTAPKMFHATVIVNMLPARDIEQRIRNKARPKLTKKAKAGGFSKQAGKIIIIGQPSCKVKENKCTAKVKAKFEK